MQIEFTKEELLTGRTDMMRPPLTEVIELIIPGDVSPLLVLDDREWIDLTTNEDAATGRRRFISPAVELEPPQLKWRDE